MTRCHASRKPESLMKTCIGPKGFSGLLVRFVSTVPDNERYPRTTTMEQLHSNVSKVLDYVVPDIKTRIDNGKRPVVLGITGLQGSGKSTWASSIVDNLQTKHGLRAISVSLDDFYRTHDNLVKLRNDNPDNKLFRTRGHPGTHDEALARDFFDSFRKGSREVRIPVFDKSQFNGEGDRTPESIWPTVSSSVDVVVFEGWCVGFQPISSEEIVQRRETAATKSVGDSASEPIHTLARHELEHIQQVNEHLTRYCATFMGAEHFDFFVQLDTDRLTNVYTWRKQQEHALIQSKGTGMTDDEVSAFIQGYMPAYELYRNNLQRGFFHDGNEGKQQIRVLLGTQREVLSICRV